MLVRDEGLGWYTSALLICRETLPGLSRLAADAAFWAPGQTKNSEWTASLKFEAKRTIRSVLSVILRTDKKEAAQGLDRNVRLREADQRVGKEARLVFGSYSSGQEGFRINQGGMLRWPSRYEVRDGENRRSGSVSFMLGFQCAALYGVRPGHCNLKVESPRATRRH
jgi:hypothetical protein